MRQRKMRKNRLLAMLSVLTACALAFVCGSVLNTPAQPALAETTSGAPAYDPSPAIYVNQKNANSVVGVLTNDQTWSQSEGVTNKLISQGSGVVIADNGYILTNYHVIEGGTAYQVLMPDGEKIDAKYIGGDSSTDLAVLQVEGDAAKQLVPVSVGSTENLPVGSTVIAIGNPGGEDLANTVTQGIVSALERTSVTASGASRRISYIQYDAPINSGNSGGGLFNYRGDLIGINTLKYSGSAYSAVTFEGLGFAIPIETVTDIASDLIEYGKVIRPALGVQVAAYTGPDEPMGSYPPASVCIYAVNEGGAAEKAGLKTYDFIYAVNGVRVKTLTELTTQLDMHEPGDTVQVTVIRYNNATQAAQNSYYNYGYGFGGGQSGNSSQAQTGEVIVSGGYEEITLDLVLEELK